MKGNQKNLNLKKSRNFINITDELNIKLTEGKRVQLFNERTNNIEY